MIYLQLAVNFAVRGAAGQRKKATKSKESTIKGENKELVILDKNIFLMKYKSQVILFLGYVCLRSVDKLFLVILVLSRLVKRCFLFQRTPLFLRFYMTKFLERK